MFQMPNGGGQGPLAGLTAGGLSPQLLQQMMMRRSMALPQPQAMPGAGGAIPAGGAPQPAPGGAGGQGGGIMGMLGGGQGLGGMLGLLQMLNKGGAGAPPVMPMGQQIQGTASPGTAMQNPFMNLFGTQLGGVRG